MAGNSRPLRALLESPSHGAGRAAESREGGRGAARGGLRGDPRPRLRQPARRPGHAVLLLSRRADRRTRLRRGRGGGRRLGPGGRAPARARRSPGPGRGRPSGDGADRGGLQRRSHLGARGDRHHRNQRQDDHRLPGQAPARGRGPPLRPLGDRPAGGRRSGRGGGADDAGSHRPAADLRPDARVRRRVLRDGGLLTRPGPAPRRRHPLRGQGLHQPEPGPSRLPRGHGGLLRGEEAALLRRGRRTDHRARGRRLGDQRRRCLWAPARRGSRLRIGRGVRQLLGRRGAGRPERSRRHLRRVRLPLRLCHARRGDRGADPASGGLQRLERPGGAERRSRARVSISPRPQRPSLQSSRCPAASSRSTRVSPSRWWSTTRIRPTRWRTCSGPPAGSPPAA